MVGQFKDDQLQKHKHWNNPAVNFGAAGSATSNFGGVQLGSVFASYLQTNGVENDVRYGDVNRGKRKGVKYIIKVL